MNNDRVKHEIMSIIAKLDNGSHSSNQLQGVDESLFKLFEERCNISALLKIQGIADMGEFVDESGLRRDMLVISKVCMDARKEPDERKRHRQVERNS